METMTPHAEVVATGAVLAAHEPRPSLLRRVAARCGAVFAVCASVLFGFAGVSSAAPLPTPSDLPNANDAVTSVASTVSNSLTTQFVAILPYVIAVAVLFTIFGIAMKLFRLKRRPS